MKLFSKIAAFACILSLTSCLGESTNTITQDFTPYIFNYVTDQNSQITSVSTDGTFTMKSSSDGLIDINLGNVKLPNGAYINLELTGLNYSITENGAQRITVPSYTSVVNGVSHQVTGFYMDLYMRYLGSQAYYLVVCNYVVDSQYSVRVVYTPACYWGSTMVTDKDGKVYTNDAQTTFYGIAFSPDKSRATIACINAKFAESMPAMSLSLDDLPYTLTQNGFTIEAAEVTPTMGGIPYPTYKITNVKATGYYGGPVYVSFTCTIDTEKVKGEYAVSAALDVMPKNTGNQ